MLFRTLSAAVYGIDADLVDIEVDLTPVRGETDQSPFRNDCRLARRSSARIARTHPRRDPKLRLLLSHFKRSRSISRRPTCAKKAQASICPSHSEYSARTVSSPSNTT